VDNDIAGTDWTDIENDLIVADYFSMLMADLTGNPYVKSHHNDALQKMTGRSRGSIERKHMNISAVLNRLGFPRIKGYAPNNNFQNGLIAAVDRYLVTKGKSLLSPELMPRNTVSERRTGWNGPENAAIILQPLVEVLNGYGAPPTPDSSDQKSTDALDRLVRKFDPAARDAKNRKLGLEGEQAVLDFERRLLISNGRSDLARRVEWTSQERGDGAGYDIASFSLDGTERLIEVKTTNGSALTPFYLTENERLFSEERPRHFRLVRLYDFALVPNAFELAPPLTAHLSLSPTSYRASVI
jgi:hypothetical protein